ncbi:MAG: LuxR family transcriptional regulator [Chitinophagia bacterium]|nr:LuxR family transcriptional regulator [Chitinophagia bacterium]
MCFSFLQCLQKPATMTAVSYYYGVKLTNREKEIWEYALAGMTSREIAEKLCITVNTVSNHRKAILRKKGLRSFSSLVRDGRSRMPQCTA